MKRFFISCTCVMMLCTGAMAASWESDHETLLGTYLFSLKNPAAASGSMWDYATLDTLSTFIKSEFVGQDVTFGTVSFTDLISLAADGEHYFSMVNTITPTVTPSIGTFSALGSDLLAGNGTGWDTFLKDSDIGVTIQSYNDIATSGLTFATTDPTAASDNGQYINTTDAGRWSKNDDWLCEDGVGCTAIYTVTITDPENGELSSVTLGIDSATEAYSVDVVAGTGPVTDWVFTPDSGYACDSVTGFDSGDCTGASLTVDGDETLGVSFTGSGVVVYSDDFEDNSLSADWLTITGYADPTEADGQLKGGSSMIAAVIDHTVIDFADDQKSCITIAYAAAGGPAVRADATRSTFYYITTESGVDEDISLYYRSNSSTKTTLGTYTGVASTGDEICLGISGSTLTVYINGVAEAQTYDHATLTTGNPAIVLYSAGAEAFSATDL